MQQVKVSVYLEGFDSRSLDSFKSFFDEKCASNFEVSTSIESAKIIIADHDVVGATRLSHLKLKLPYTPFILLSKRDLNRNDHQVISLQKPLEFNYLKKTLESLTKHYCTKKTMIDLRPLLLEKMNKEATLDSNTTSYDPSQSQLRSPQLTCLVGGESHKSFDENNPHSVMKIVFDPDRYLMGSILKAMKRTSYEKKMLDLTNLNARIIIDPDEKKIYTFAKESVLRPICLMELRETSTVKIIKGGNKGDKFQTILREHANEITQWSWDAFLWKLSLWTSRGKIPKNIDIRKPVHISEWPNLTRLHPIPHAIAIAAMMKNSHKTMVEIAKQLKIELRFVLAFFTACHTLGLANNSKRQSDTLFEPESKSNSPEKQSLLHKLFGKVNKPQTESPQDINQGVSL
ncbi:hypothetical protein [Pleionea sediminis]|uniref:hypothetical protein n=1 Tax=Pleionea sediminis TaxID=2569479 RepID=UPI001185BD79|nr:hypothetical protein [Pleionea sediminis]